MWTNAAEANITAIGAHVYAFTSSYACGDRDHISSTYYGRTLVESEDWPRIGDDGRRENVGLMKLTKSSARARFGLLLAALLRSSNIPCVRPPPRYLPHHDTHRSVFMPGSQR